MAKKYIYCPKCKSDNIAEIVYGEIALDKKTMDDIKAGRIYLGGCCVDKDSPKYHCNKCEHQFNKGLWEDLDKNNSKLHEDVRNALDQFEQNTQRYFAKQQEELKELADLKYGGDIEEAKKHYNDWIREKIEEETKRTGKPYVYKL